MAGVGFGGPGDDSISTTVQAVVELRAFSEVHNVVHWRRKDGVGDGEGRPAAGAAGGPDGLDQKRENRETVTRAPYRPILDDLEDGELVARPTRSGGAFDPLGCRSSDVTRADDVVALVDGHPGRWLMVTLTVNRSLWIGPEACYQRVCDRVREVARRISLKGVHVTALELQGKTGEGWPHWHLIVWAPDERTRDELAAEVRAAWCVVTEHVDQDSGEVTRSRESIGFSRVDVAREREGVARYAAKYLLKSWPAVPAWMGESRRQLRKLRISSGAFDWLEGEGRHVRHRGGRRAPKSRRRPARKLFDRMASSGLRHAVFRRSGERLEFVCTLPVPSDQDGFQLMLELGAEPIRLGSPGAVRWRISRAVMERARGRRAELEVKLRATYRHRRVRLEVAWDVEQQRDG